MGVRLTLDGV